MIYLRNISTDDYRILSAIHDRSFDEQWGDSSFQNMLMDPAFFGFIVGREVEGQKNDYGFILCRRILEEIEIITFCVAPEQQRRGYGKLLMVETIKQAGLILHAESEQLDSISIFLEVAETNATAINLYRTFGFEKISKRKHYYRTPNGEIDADVMVLKLCSEVL